MAEHVGAQDVQRGALVLERGGQHEAHGALFVELLFNIVDEPTQGLDVVRLGHGGVVRLVGDAQHLLGEGKAVLERAVQGEGVQVALRGRALLG